MVTTMPEVVNGTTVYDSLIELVQEKAQEAGLDAHTRVDGTSFATFVLAHHGEIPLSFGREIEGIGFKVSIGLDGPVYDLEFRAEVFGPWSHFARSQSLLEIETWRIRYPRLEAMVRLMLETKDIAVHLHKPSEPDEGITVQCVNKPVHEYAQRWVQLVEQRCIEMCKERYAVDWENLMAYIVCEHGFAIAFPLLEGDEATIGSNGQMVLEDFFGGFEMFQLIQNGTQGHDELAMIATRFRKASEDLARWNRIYKPLEHEEE